LIRVTVPPHIDEEPCPPFPSNTHNPGAARLDLETHQLTPNHGSSPCCVSFRTCCRHCAKTSLAVQPLLAPRKSRNFGPVLMTWNRAWSLRASPFTSPEICSRTRPATTSCFAASI